MKLGAMDVERAERDRRVHNRVEADLRRASELYDQGVTDVDQLFKEVTNGR